MLYNTKRFLIFSCMFLIILCAIVFYSVTFLMTGKSDTTISNIGIIYMSEMNKQLQEKFQSIMDLRMVQLSGIIKRTPSETVSYGE